ncbi:MAG: HAD-IC family P-type ATPase, partial [Candidatus Nanohaloarchaea archaeon]
MKDWHSASIEEVFSKLGTGREGLESEEAEKRLEKEGMNEIKSDEEVSPLKIFVSQFQDFLIYLLLAAALLSVGIGFLPGQSPQLREATLIAGILFANGVFGFIQDYKAEKSIEAFKNLSTPEATVIRDGKKVNIDASEVVPGDVIMLDQGDAVPADARIIEQSSLSTDESALTGESTNVEKQAGTKAEDVPVAEMQNMVFKNTSVVKGRGKAVVVETGMDTEVGSIASQIESAE